MISPMISKTRASFLLLFLALPVASIAQRGGMYSPLDFPWWDSPVARNLNLSETQTAQIASTVKEYRDRVLELRAAVNKADADLEQIFDENPVDQRKANDAIDRLASARGDLTKALSQMSLKLRGVLTADQWQMLQQRQPGRMGPGRPGGPGGGPRRRSPQPPSTATPTATPTAADAKQK